MSENERLDTQNWFKLTIGNLKGLYFYYTLLLLIGLAVTVTVILYESLLNKLNISEISILGGIGTALLGSSIFYLRKLYKASINNLMSDPIDNNDRKRQLGVLFYYYLRPLFAIIFSILFHLSLKGSVAIISISEVILDSGMIYLTLIVSFFLGFAAGDMITKIEIYSKSVVDKTMNRF